MRRHLLVLAAVGVLIASPAVGEIFVPESNNDVVYLIDDVTGAVIDCAYLDIAANAGGVSSTPIEVLEVGNELWVSDQIADVIWRFDQGGTFIDSFGAGDFNNIRGMEVVGDTVYVAMGSDSTNWLRGVLTVDVPTVTVTGRFTNFETADISYFDVLEYNGELLVPNIDSGNDRIERYAFDGTYLGNFATSDGATSFDFMQQLAVRDNGNLLGAGFSLPSGVYEFLPDGTPLGIVAADGFGPRGAYELPNGEVLWTNGSFVRTDGTIFLDGNSFRFITETQIPEPATAAFLLFGAAALLRKKR